MSYLIFNILLIFYLVAVLEPSIEEAFQRLSKFIPRYPGDPEKLSKVRIFIIFSFLNFLICFHIPLI